MDTGKKVLLIGGLGLAAWWYFSSSSSGIVTPLPTDGATGGATPPPAPAPTPILDQTYTALLGAMTAAASGDSAITNVAGQISASADVFNFYLAHLPNTPVVTPPAPGSVFPAPVPPMMTAAQYWDGMAPFLKNSLGLSGLGHFGGLGAFMARVRL